MVWPRMRQDDSILFASVHRTYGVLVLGVRRRRKRFYGSQLLPARPPANHSQGLKCLTGQFCVLRQHPLHLRWSAPLRPPMPALQSSAADERAIDCVMLRLVLINVLGTVQPLA